MMMSGDPAADITDDPAEDVDAMIEMFVTISSLTSFLDDEAEQLSSSTTLMETSVGTALMIALFETLICSIGSLTPMNPVPPLLSQIVKVILRTSPATIGLVLLTLAVRYKPYLGSTDLTWKIFKTVVSNNIHMMSDLTG